MTRRCTNRQVTTLVAMVLSKVSPAVKLLVSNLSEGVIHEAF